jgi:hypothetical protein
LQGILGAGFSLSALPTDSSNAGFPQLLVGWIAALCASQSPQDAFAGVAPDKNFRASSATTARIKVRVDTKEESIQGHRPGNACKEIHQSAQLRFIFKLIL